MCVYNINNDKEHSAGNKPCPSHLGGKLLVFKFYSLLTHVQCVAFGLGTYRIAETESFNC